MKKLSFVIPIMILVASIAIWMLNKDYSEIDWQIRMMIAGGAAVLSGIISFFLLGNEEKEGDQFPDFRNKRK
ncbi:sugar phosphate permease [Oikeobacillus pervagus]|uniref:Sugar phosphate permease n=1 Tax=Oikeobacillus pervagus TaxID=1325931 RepID=A0AAJ1T3J7_9BACI|nr:hypothetical protein [Oikeobacillus pervagus]MDQ0215274.1 sugar phosphate permease [Oikeobacillus pervagus]